MEIRVSGHQIDTGAALQEHVTDRLNAIVEKYFSRALSSPGHLRQGARRRVHLRHRAPREPGPDPQGARPGAGRAPGVRPGGRQDRKAAAPLQAPAQGPARAGRSRRSARKTPPTPCSTPATPRPRKSTPMRRRSSPRPRVDIPEASVSDAVMMLDLRNTNALFFKNAGTGRHNMVYRRGDGSIGWVEPS